MICDPVPTPEVDSPFVETWEENPITLGPSDISNKATIPTGVFEKSGEQELPPNTHCPECGTRLVEYQKFGSAEVKTFCPRRAHHD